MRPEHKEIYLERLKKLEEGLGGRTKFVNLMRRFFPTCAASIVSHWFVRVMSADFAIKLSTILKNRKFPLKEYYDPSYLRVDLSDEKTFDRADEILK